MHTPASGRREGKKARSLHQRKKSELIWMANHRCEHRHTFIEHPQCYAEGRAERVGFLDIEASNLVADFGFVLSWCILDDATGVIHEDVISKADISKAKAGDEDKRVVRSLIDKMSQYDRIVGYYSVGFDIPFIRTRALSMGVEFPTYGSIKHTDIYFAAKAKLKLSSKRQENVCRVLLGATEKTRLEPKYWRGASRGDKKSLAYVLDHNRADVRDLQRFYHKMLPYLRLKDTGV